MSDLTATDKTLAEHLGEFAYRAYAGGVPEDVGQSVRQRVLDVLGLCIAAYRLDTSEFAVAHVLAQGGRAAAHVVGVPQGVSAAQAAFANGVLAHSLDYDDTHLPSVLHPSASVVPAALAVAESVGATGEQVIRAIAIGLEVNIRLGMAGYDKQMGNSVYFEHGQHATSICGAMGSAVSAALLMGHDAVGVRNALGLAASMAGGVIEANRTGGTVKRLHCGLAAQSGVTAAELVSQGFTGPPTVLEGRFGFFEAFLHGQFKASEVTDGLGETWCIPDIFFKPYPANHFTHTSVDAGRAIRARGIALDDIESMTLGVPAPVIRTIGEPLEKKRTPSTAYEAQFSGPYAVVLGLLGGSGLGAGLDDYTDELAQDPTRRALMARVDVVADDRCTEIFPYQFPAVLTVRLNDGTEVTEEVLANRGGNRNPLSDDELVTKFRDNAGSRLSAHAMARVEELVLGLHDVNDVAQILEAICQFSADDSTSRFVSSPL